MATPISRRLLFWQIALIAFILLYFITKYRKKQPERTTAFSLLPARTLNPAKICDSIKTINQLLWEE